MSSVATRVNGFVTTAFLLVASGGALSAQTRCVPSSISPVILVHGINADARSWQSFEDYLATQIANPICRPTLGQERPLADQAQTLSAMYGASGPVILVGHSQGGLVSREAARQMAVSALITVGTPHTGAPIALREADIRFFGALSSAEATTVAQAWYTHRDYVLASGEIYHNVDDFRYQAAGTAAYGALLANQVVQSQISQFLNGQPALRDLGGATSFLASLNSTTNLAREQSEIPIRIGIVSASTQYSEYAGPFALLFSPYEAENTMYAAEVSGWYLMEYGAELLVASDYSEPWYWDDLMGGSAALDLGSNLVLLPSIWCNWIGGCGGDEGDFIVPGTRQVYPGAEFDGISEGPTHNHETSSLTVQTHIRDFLRSRLNI